MEWFVGTEDKQVGLCVHDGTPKQGLVICQVRDQAREYAPLIAAAPDLLEACKAHNAVGDHVLLCPRCGDGRQCNEYDRLWNKADRMSREAVKKVAD